MSKLDDLITGIKNVPKDNAEYDKGKFKELMLELIDQNGGSDALDRLKKKVVEL